MADKINKLARQYLNRRIPDFAVLQTEVAAWEKQRNHEQTWINFRFTTADAQVKLHRLYPSIAG